MRGWTWLQLGVNLEHPRYNRRAELKIGVGSYNVFMSQRESDFLEPTKRALASRAGWCCSFTGCGKLTIGPSDESPESSASIGVAAHICAASKGGRRYDAGMSPEQRRGIGNGIWLCADHATLIDRDDVTYAPSVLYTMKRDHEAACAKAVRSGTGVDFAVQLFAVGPELVFTGGFERVDAGSWTLKIKHFLIGNFQELVLFISDFENSSADRHYILSNELGEGRQLASAPSLNRQQNGCSLVCYVAPSASRVDAQKIGSGIASHPETNDIYLDETGSIARVSGLDYFPQRVQELLSMQRGESIYEPHWGVLFFEYFSEFNDSPWLDPLMKLEVIRQASIPLKTSSSNGARTPLQCVTRVYDVVLLSKLATQNRLPIRLDFEVQGYGRWQREVSIYMPTEEQMIEVKQRLEAYPYSALRSD